MARKDCGRLVVLASLAAGVLLVGATALPLARPASAQVVPPDAEALWQHLQQERYRDNWALWPGKGTKYEGTDPHGALLTTYLNPPGHEGATQQPGQMPPGTVIVKENYMPDGTLDAITTMHKVEGFDPEHGDWYYVKFDPRGKAEEHGRLEMCIACHSKASDNDYIFTGPVR